MGSLPFREGTGFREPVPGTGSGNRFRELVPGKPDFPDPRAIAKVSGFRRFRARGFAGFGVRWARLGSVPELWTEPVLGTRGIKKGSGLRRFRSQGSEKVTVSLLWKYTCVLGKYIYTFVLGKPTFVLWKVCFCTLKVCFCTLKAYFCTWKVYFCTLKVYFCTLKVYFCTLNAHFCTLKV